MKKIISILVLLVVSLSLYAMSAEDIAKKYEANSKYNSSIIEATIVIEDSLGTSTQKVLVHSQGDTDTLIEITAGPDKGQKVLRKDNSIYLFYPDAEQIIRLQGAALKESFMGSDFSYEDLSKDNSILSNYSVELTGEDENTYTLELTAKSKTMAYQKETLTIDKTNFSLLKATLKSASGRALRELVNSDIRKVNNYYVPFVSMMKDLIKQQGSTEFTINSIKVDEKINPRMFTKENLSW